MTPVLTYLSRLGVIILGLCQLTSFHPEKNNNNTFEQKAKGVWERKKCNRINKAVNRELYPWIVQQINKSQYNTCSGIFHQIFV